MRTNFDFSKHKLIIKKTDDFSSYELLTPDTAINHVKFTNIDGLCLVTGDFYNWVFCRGFHPTKDGSVSDHYWCEKLQLSSSQNPYKWSAKKCRSEIEEKIKELEDCDYEPKEIDELKEFWNNCLNHIEDGCSVYYEAYAHGEKPYYLEHEDIPRGIVIQPYLEIIFDAFEEICKRMSMNPEIQAFEELSKLKERQS